MSGGSTGSTSKQTTETNNTNISDNSGFAVGSIKDTTVEVLDGGAIQSSYNFATETQANFGKSFESVLGLVEKSIDAQGEIVGQYSAAKVNEETLGMAAMMPIALLSVAGFFVFKILTKV